MANKYLILSEIPEPVFEGTFSSISINDIRSTSAYEQYLSTDDLFVSGVFSYDSKYYGTICKLVSIRHKKDELMSNDEVTFRFECVMRVELIDIETKDGLFEPKWTSVKEFNQSFDDKNDLDLDKYLDDVNEIVSRASEHDSLSGKYLKIDPIHNYDIADWVKTNVKYLAYPRKKILFADQRAKVVLESIVESIKIEIAEAIVENDIEEKTQKNIEKDQTDYFLHEKLKTINQELYGTDNDAEVYRAKIEALNASQDIKDVLFAELVKVSGMSAGSPEGYVARNYIDTVCSLPWGKYSEETLSLANAKEILEVDHYGIEEVKERVMEFLAIHKLVKNKKGNILCFYGPPGTGKTSIVRSIARSLNRKYVRLSLGGVHDEAEIRGHRRTYIGALAGKIITSIRDAGTMNPVFLMDEIDKLSHDYKGDPSSALLEVLDPEQNKAFRDNFIDLPFDLSQVLFITTANDITTIPRPLLDRMELIEMSGYTIEEKREIALRHLIPKQLSEHAVPEGAISFEPSAVEHIIQGYTSEAGVRKLEQSIAKIIRKIAVEYGDVGFPNITVNTDVVRQYLGVARHYEQKIDEPEVGVITGLAYTSYGGTTLELECVLSEGDGKVQMTGNLGDVMIESAKLALTYVKSNYQKYGIDPIMLKKDVHVNATEGGVPKDGPSAGIALTTLILSAFTGKKIRTDAALTGEVTLKGKVLPIGGVKEKSLGAIRKGITTVIMPEDNRADVEELAENIKSKLNYIFVSKVDQVFEVMLIENN